MNLVELKEVLHMIRNESNVIHERLIAKVITAVEENHEDIENYLDDILLSKNFSSAKSKVLGITGAPGVGKSTFLSNLIPRFSAQGISTAVMAFDPSSAVSGGAFLGDRVRCLQSLSDSKTFFRSMSNRGHLGGVSKSCPSVIKALQICGFDLIIIETIGVGQNEVEIRNLSDVVVLLLDANSGDYIQAEKSGIMEIADIFLINKSDLNAKRILESSVLEAMNMRGETRNHPAKVLSMTVKTESTIDLAFSEIERRLGFY